MGDSQAVQPSRQVPNRQWDAIRFQPRRLDLAPVAQAGPGTADPAGGCGPGGSWKGQGRTELRHSGSLGENRGVWTKRPVATAVYGGDRPAANEGREVRRRSET